MFESTLPLGAPELKSAASFSRQLDGAAAGARLSSLGATLTQDLHRFDASDGESLEALDVLAAALRHQRSLRMHLQHDARVIPLTIHPSRREVLGPISAAQFTALPLGALSVMHVEPAPTEPEASAMTLPLGYVAWELALRGVRAELLPEIAGANVYRVAPGTAIESLHLSGTLAAATRRLRQHPTALNEIAGWPGFDRDRALRLLNGLYLQAALIVSRAR